MQNKKTLLALSLALILLLGGAFIAAAAESYKGKLRDLLAWYRRQMELWAGKYYDALCALD